MAKELEDKVAIVTGAGTGIGQGIAELFAEEGAQVVLTGRRESLLNETATKIVDAGNLAPLVVSGDVSQEDDVAHLFGQTLEKCGQVDVVVNNAAVAGEVGNIWELSYEGWSEAVAINLTGPWLCSRAAARAMIPRRFGKIINIGSISGKRPLATRTPYTATKMGLVGLTKTCALELGEHGINVNVISPAAVDTPRLRELAEKWRRPFDELVKGAAAQAALKRISTPRDVAECALFLATERSRNITGIDITVDAGVVFI